MNNEYQDHHYPASRVLQNVVDGHKADMISFGDIMELLHERGFGLLMLIFVLPNCIPAPIPPPLPSILSIPLLFLSAQMLIGRKSPWLPKWLRSKSLKRSTLAMIVEKIVPRLYKIERILRPRFSFASSTKGERIVGGIWLLFALSIAIPLPMTNLVPGIGILIMSLGLLSKDGLVITAGIGIGILGVSITTAVMLVGVHAARALFGI